MHILYNNKQQIFRGAKVLTLIGFNPNVGKNYVTLVLKVLHKLMVKTVVRKTVVAYGKSVKTMKVLYRRRFVAHTYYPV